MNRFYVRTYMRVDPDELALMSMGSAVQELAHLNFIQSENIYSIVEMDEAGEEVDEYRSPNSIEIRLEEAEQIGE